MFFFTQNKNGKRIETSAILAFVFFLLPAISFAATFHLEPQSSVLGTENTFSIAVLLDSEKSVNTLSVGIVFPKSLEPNDIETGESIVNFWIDKPSWNETTRTLTFSGLIPGGVEGTDLPLVTINCAVIDPSASATVSFDSDTRAYLSDGKATEDALSLEDLVLPVASGKQNLSPDIPDTVPPEAFVPVISKDPTVFNGLWFLAFSTEDKGGGVAYYEVKENRPGILGLFFPSAWQKVESPYLLADQSLRSEIDVRALDKAGNARLEVLPARSPLPWYESILFWIIIVVVFLSYAFIRFKRHGKIF